MIIVDNLTLTHILKKIRLIYEIYKIYYYDSNSPSQFPTEILYTTFMSLKHASQHFHLTFLLLSP
jgi:hypothetical protein